MDDEPIAISAYEVLAECYAERAPTKTHNAFYDRPVEQLKESEPEDNQKLMRQPGFICFRAAKPA